MFSELSEFGRKHEFVAEPQPEVNCNMLHMYLFAESQTFPKAVAAQAARNVQKHLFILSVHINVGISLVWKQFDVFIQQKLDLPIRVQCPEFLTVY